MYPNNARHKGRRAAECLLIAVLLTAAVFPSFSGNDNRGQGEPAGLPRRQWPADNPYSPEKAELGRKLFFDPRLSVDGTISCATCHDPNYAFAENKAVATGVRGQQGTRNTPTIVNRAYSQEQFWDGRAASLEEQAIGPIVNPIEMGNTMENCVRALSGIPEYASLFRSAFGDFNITTERIAKALATYERTVLSGNAPYDRYKSGDKKALSESAKRGEKVFTKAQCDLCHFGPNFTDGSFANTGVGMDRPDPDVGRYAVLKRPMDWGAFKVPTLRDIAKTAPYMHDGSLATLREVIDLYDRGGVPNRNLDRRYKRLGLKDREKEDLVEFLKSLSGEITKF
jgi:cytochrome c peroxidase